jgi:uncharacterized protein YndB with AHSA1/START domain
VATAVITPNQDAVIAEIEIAAPPERVFQALVDSKQAHAWSANEFCELTAWEMDIRPGGACRSVTKEKASGREWAHYGEILKSNLLTCWSTPGLPTFTNSPQNRWEFTPTPCGTKVKLMHSGLADEPKARADYSGGWPGVLEESKKYLEG